MRLRNRFRASAAISFATILLLAAVLGLSWHASNRASAAQELTRSLRRQILERGIVRDEYFAYREERARALWYAKSARMTELLKSSGSAFDAADERKTIGEMVAIIEQSDSLFGEIVGLTNEQGRKESEQPLSIALRERVTNRLLLLSYDLYSRANRLAESASRRAKSTERTTLLAMMGMVGTALAITIVNSTMTSRLLERRITRLQAGAERIAAGDFAHRIGFEGDDELAALGRSFDAMAARLEQTVLGLESSNRELEAFSYSVSHDLRAPLRAVDGFSRILLEDYAPQLDTEGKRLLGVVRTSSRQMGQLIDDLLSFSRVGRQEMARTAADMKALADEAFRGLVAANERVSFTVGELPGADVDPALMTQVWVNLISNALKFTRPKSGRVIEVAGRAEPGRVVYSVKDNGVGFDMAYRDKLFGVFQRLHSSHEFEGTGVGLALVQRIVHRHGGDVWAEGKVGEGATFSFSLPAGGSP